MPPDIIFTKLFTCKCDLLILGMTGIEKAEKAPPDF
jgi:hypothetical protein